MKNLRRPSEASYSLPLPPLILFGTAIAAAFYAILRYSPLDLELLRRYCMSHPVAVASVWLFSIGIVGLVTKWYTASTQVRLTRTASASLRRLVAAGREIALPQRAEWLTASWDAEPQRLRDSWLGARLRRVLELQLSRGRRQELERDLSSQAEQEADRQHDSYSLLRIIHWAMPMLGFLGTVLGISQTLGQLDTEKLASQQQAAMDQLTGGLYVAFDTTAIALTLTVVSMFIQFAISRIEVRVVQRIDGELVDNLVGFLAVDPFDAEANLLGPVREMATHLVATVETLVRQQASMWSQSISESQRQWTGWTEQAAERAEQQLGSGIAKSLESHVESMRRLQEDANRQLEARWQQWQTTLSDQARNAQQQQRELSRQTESIQQLLSATVDLRKMEEVVQESIGRLEHVGRLEHASHCVGEAVAVLAASLERAGVIRGVPIKPRPAHKESPATVIAPQATAVPGVSGDSRGASTGVAVTPALNESHDEPTTLPLHARRKAA